MLEYSGLGVFIGAIDLSANPPPFSGQRLLEDLSAVGNTIDNPVPEPTTLALMGLGLAGLGRKLRRKVPV